MSLLLRIALLIHWTTSIHGLDNGLALTPPMGWMSWSRFFCEIDCTHKPFECINEMLYKQHADRLVADGFYAVGYRSIHIDDCWTQKSRDEQGDLVPDHQRFAHGVRQLADYVSRPRPISAPSDARTQPEPGHLRRRRHVHLRRLPGQQWPRARRRQHVRGLAGGLPQVRRLQQQPDGNCETYGPSRTGVHVAGYPLMSRALLASGRRIVFSCEWPLNVAFQETNYTAIAESCNLWRNCHDVQNSWSSILSIIDYYVRHQDLFAKFQKPGAWNDPDMLVAGNEGVSFSQARAQFVVWCMWSAPLIMSNDLRLLDDQHRELLQNQRLIAVDQDKYGVLAKVVKTTPQLYYFVKPLSPVNGRSSFAIAVLNYSKDNATALFKPLEFGMKSQAGYHIQELVSGASLKDSQPDDLIRHGVPATDAIAFRFTAKA